jgi:hypothetical protein
MGALDRVASPAIARFQVVVIQVGFEADASSHAPVLQRLGAPPYEPLVRERKLKGHLTIIWQMIAGCASAAAAYLTGTIPEWGDGANFLGWFSDWMEGYLAEKGMSFAEVRERKRVRLGVVPPPARRLADPATGISTERPVLAQSTMQVASLGDLTVPKPSSFACLGTHPGQCRAHLACARPPSEAMEQFCCASVCPGQLVNQPLLSKPCPASIRGW